MTSVLCGISAAFLWGGSNLLMSLAARGSRPVAFAFWFFAYSVALLLVPVMIVLPTIRFSQTGLTAAALAGIAEAVGLIVYARALGVGQISIIAPLVSLEGAFAALIAIIGGEAISIAAGLGLAGATAGTFLASAAPAKGTWSAPGAIGAVVAGLLLGLALWLIGQDSVSPLLALVVLNSVAALLVGLVAGIQHAERRIHAVLAGAAGLGVLGFVFYIVGTRNGSLATTAVLAGQFSVFAALGGYAFFGERLGRRQVIGVALLVLGVSVVTVSSA